MIGPVYNCNGCGKYVSKRTGVVVQGGDHLFYIYCPPCGRDREGILV